MSQPFEFRGFDLVRRGYNRYQVDRYLKDLSEADSPVGPPPFQIVGRGYDRQQVDARIRDLLADKGTNG
ncbi:hypothetical protein AB0L85_30280 [Streptomyces sp. NPDC052051]|uniref:hypothetical protein n=1 Tax=Streptomyces sp. NPDC052051 TaxID=3154649 RepID=UPI00342B4D47